MTAYRASADDRDFLEAVESGALPAASFDHRAHVRLAYLNLAEQSVDAALVSFRATLQAFIRAQDIDPGKYHETITVAWLLAVRHFMDGAGACASADEFIERCPRLLDTSIMMTHYSQSRLFSTEARASYVAPDLTPIPIEHDWEIGRPLR